MIFIYELDSLSARISNLEKVKRRKEELPGETKESYLLIV